MALSDLQISEKTKEHLLEFKNKFRSAELVQNDAKEKRIKRKDPFSLFQVRNDVQSIKVGDSLVESVSKLYRLMKKNDNDEILQHELENDRLEGELEEEDRNNEKLIRDIKKHQKIKKTEPEKEKDGGFLGFIKKIIEKVSKYITDAVKMLGELGEKLVSGVKGIFSGKGFAVGAAGLGAVAGSRAVMKVKQKEMMKNVYDAFINAGFSDNQSKALTAEVGRENGYDPKFVFGSHIDAANGALNIGFFSWQGSRAEQLKNYMQEQGLMDESGKIQQSQASLNAMANFVKFELSSGKFSGVGNFLQNKDVDSETAARQLGTGYIKWAYGQDKLSSGKAFDWKTHDIKRAGYYGELEKIVSSNKPTTQTITSETSKETPPPVATNTANGKTEKKQSITKIASVEVPKEQPKPTTTPVASQPTQQQSPSELSAKQTNIDAKTVTLMSSNQNIGESMLNTSIDNKVGKNGLKRQQTNITNISNYVLKPGDKHIHETI